LAQRGQRAGQVDRDEQEVQPVDRSQVPVERLESTKRGRRLESKARRRGAERRPSEPGRKAPPPGEAEPPGTRPETRGSGTRTKALQDARPRGSVERRAAPTAFGRTISPPQAHRRRWITSDPKSEGVATKRGRRPDCGRANL
jgi:hypothetical protein